MSVIFVNHTNTMKRYYRLNVIWIAFWLFLSGCTLNKQEPPAAPKQQLFDWLPGIWEFSAGEVRMAEQWKRIDSTNLEGASWYITRGDSLLMEKLRITECDSGTYYFAEVSSQNQGRRIDFRLTSSEQNQWVFENPGHDFPQKITYERISSDSLKASIEGIQEGKPRREEFRMGRKKPE